MTKDEIEELAKYAEAYLFTSIAAALLTLSAERDTLAAKVAAAYEDAAQICEQNMRDFLSEEYAVGQPLSSFSERFACKQCARDIRARTQAPSEGA
jgi:hypothetical protein